MTTELKAVESPWDFVPAFTLDEDGGSKLKVTVDFDRSDYSKPLSVTFMNPDRDGHVTVDWDLWKRVVAAVERAADQ